MKLNKKELIISLIMIVTFVFIGINLETLATNNNGNILDWNGINFGNTDSNTTIDNNATDTGKDGEEIPQINSTNSNASNNNPDQLADTGLEDWPWIIIAICAISTVFAYKKIKEYKEN